MTRLFSVLSTATIVAALACGRPAYSDDQTPIVVGSINALSGPVVYDESSAAAKAVFDDFNSSGGLRGRKIEYLILDDRTDPATASSAARDAVENQGAVALVGSMSILDCAVNGAYYVRTGIVSIPGLGADTFCYTNANISPTNMGPYVGAELTLQAATETLKLDKICGVVGVGGGAEAAYREVFARWAKRSGQNFLWVDFIPYGAPDFTPYVIRAKDAGCHTLFFNGPDELTLSLMNAAESQNAKFSYLLSASAYTQKFAEASPAGHDGAYIVSEFAPYSKADTALTADWHRVMSAHGIPLTAFSQGGYLAAKHFLKMLETMEGPITRETVTKSFKEQVTAFEDPMIGEPWLFGSKNTHSPSTTGWLVKLAPGSHAWENAGSDWISLRRD